MVLGLLGEAVARGWESFNNTESIIPTIAILRLLTTLETRTALNVSYVGISQLVVILLNLGTLAILSRILTPEDFGLVGIATIVLSLLYTVQDFGVMPSVIQRDSRIEDSVRAGLFLRWIIAGFLTFALILISPLISSFLGDSRITAVVIVLIANMFILTFGFSSQALLTRSLRFWCLSIASVVQYVVLAIVSVSLAIVGFTYWSLVFGSIAGSVSFVVVMMYFEKPLLKPVIDTELMKELLGFGKHLLVTGLMVFAIFNLDQIAVGKALGTSALGIYLIAVKFGRTPGEQISNTVNRVLFPTMARIKDNNDLIRRGYSQSLRMIAIVAVPVCVGLSALSSMFVETLLGTDWLSAILPLAIISFQGLLNALIIPASNVLVSIGRPRYMSVQSTIQAVAILLGAYPVAVTYGISGVCVFTTMLSLVVLAYFLFVFSNMFGTSFRELVGPMGYPLFSGAVMFLVLTWANQLLSTSIWSLVMLSVAGLLLYSAVLHIASRGKDTHDFINLLRRTLRAR